CSFLRPSACRRLLWSPRVWAPRPPSSELNLSARPSRNLGLFRLPPFRAFEPPLSLTTEFSGHLGQSGVVAARQNAHVVGQSHEKLCGLDMVEDCPDASGFVPRAVRFVDHNNKLNEFVAKPLPQCEFVFARKVLGCDHDAQKNVVSLFVNRQ